MQINSNQIFDNATFSFTDQSGPSKCVISALGADGEIFKSDIKIDNPTINKLLAQLQFIQNNKFRGRVRFKTNSKTVNLKFSGYKENKGVKVRAYLTGWFYYSSGGFGSYIQDSHIDALIQNLNKCLS